MLLINSIDHFLAPGMFWEIFSLLVKEIIMLLFQRLFLPLALSENMIYFFRSVERRRHYYTRLGSEVPACPRGSGTSQNQAEA